MQFVATKICTTVKCMKSINRFNDLLQVSCQYVIGYLVRLSEKSLNFYHDCKFVVILVLIFFNVRKMAEVGGKRMVVKLPHVVDLQSNMSLPIWFHGFLLTWERKTYFP